MNGRYISKAFVTTTDIDIIQYFKSVLGYSFTNAKKVTIKAEDLVTININGEHRFSDLYADPVTGIRTLSLDDKDVSISSMVIHENGVNVFVAMIVS